jgi:hypothetical protein
MQKIKTALPTLALAAPLLGFAQGPNFAYLESAVVAVQGLITQLVPLLVALALLSFIWGLVQFILASGDEAAKDVGKRRMIWGIITLFVIVSVWGLVGLLGEMSGVEMGGSVDAPSVNF